MADNTLKEMTAPGAATGLTRRYLSAEGMQTLINRIAALKGKLDAEDVALRTQLTQLVTDLEALRTELENNSKADAERDTRLDAVEADITDLQDNKVDKDDLDGYVLTTTYNTFLADEFTPLKNKVAEIITILADIVTGTEVDAAATAAGLPTAGADPNA